MSDSPAALLFDEARRLLARQEADLDTLRTKALALLTVVAAVAAFLGAKAVDLHAARPWLIIGAVLFAVTGVMALDVYRPRGFEFSWKIGNSFEWADHVDLADDDKAARALQLQTARGMDADRLRNKVTIEGLTRRFGWCCGLAAGQIVYWLIAIALSIPGPVTPSHGPSSRAPERRSHAPHVPGPHGRRPSQPVP